MMFFWLLWMNSLFLLWLFLLWSCESKPEIREVRTFPNAETGSATNSPSQEAANEDLQGQRG